MQPQKAYFRLRAIADDCLGWFRNLYWKSQGMSVGSRTILRRMHVTWPHQVRLGNRCILESDIYFKFDGIWAPGPCIDIGDDCFIGVGCEFNIRRQIGIGHRTKIASGCKFIDHDHGFEGTRIDEQPGREAAISLGEDVWMGVNVVVLKGVTIGNSAVVGACAVVTRSIPAREIWAGVPARQIGTRPALGSPSLKEA